MRTFLAYGTSRIGLTIAATGLMVAAVPASAISVSYTTNTAVFPNLGGATPGDTLTLGSASGTFTGAGTYTVNNVSFHGTRFAVTPLPFTGIFADTATTSDGPFPYSINYSLQLGAADTITLSGNSFDAGGYHFVINTLVLTAGVDVTTSGVLTATASLIGGVPEPATWAMLLIGFGGIGVAARSRRFSQSVTA